MNARHQTLFGLVLLSGILLGTGCASATGRVALTPLTVVRDVVDVPLVTVTNIFEFGADRSSPNPVPRANVGWSLGGGPDIGIGWDISWFLFKPLSLIFGGVDYIVCRSVWPNAPRGLSPWKGEGEGWGSLYFTNTRALWRDETRGEPWDYDAEPRYQRREYDEPEYDEGEYEDPGIRLPPPPELE